MKRRSRVARFAAALAFSVVVSIAAAGTLAFALELPPAPDGPVTDEAGLLSADAESRIEAKILAHEKESSDQIAVATFKSLDGDAIENVSIELAKLWKIGTEEHNNGVLLLVFVEDRMSRIEVGYGLEGRLTDALSSRILRETMTPRFRAGDFDGGVEESVDAILEIIRGEYVAPPAKQEVPLGTIWFWIVVAFVVFSWWRGSRSFWNSTLGGPLDGRRSGWTRGRSPWEDIFRGGGGFGGGGGFSGGGGSFGGGGASGKW